MSTRTIQHHMVSDRRAQGADAGDRTPLSSHTGWVPLAGRPDPVALLQERNTRSHPPRATDVMTRADSAAFAVRKVSQMVTSWMAMTTDCAQPVTKETQTR